MRRKDDVLPYKSDFRAIYPDLEQAATVLGQSQCIIEY